MSVPLTQPVFEFGVNAAPSGPPEPNSNSLESVVRSQLAAASREIALLNPKSPNDVPGGLIAGIGEYLAQTTQMWLSLTDKLVQGSHIDMAVEDVHLQSHNQHHAADMEDLVQMDLNIIQLRKIRDLTEKFSCDVMETWYTDENNVKRQSISQESTTVNGLRGPKRPRPIAGTAGAASDVESRFHSGSKILPIAQLPPTGLASPGANASASDDSDDEDELFARIDMEALGIRGKGSHYCPLGYRCGKGGVDKDGSLVLFDRNSSFAQHCNKHRKPWRCDIPGCPNPPKKRKFARRDGLERHKATVKHRVKT